MFVDLQSGDYQFIPFNGKTKIIVVMSFGGMRNEFRSFSYNNAI